MTVDTCALAGRNVRTLSCLECSHLDGAALNCDPALCPIRRDREMRTFDDSGQHGRFDREMLNVLLLHVERYRAGLFDHGGRQALIGTFADRHDAFRADRHRLRAPPQQDARALAGRERHTQCDRHAGYDIGPSGTGPEPSMPRHPAHLPRLGRFRHRLLRGQNNGDQSGGAEEKTSGKVLHERKFIVEKVNKFCREQRSRRKFSPCSSSGALC